MNNFRFSDTLIKLNNPLINIHEKLYFLKQYISPHATVQFDGKNNVIKIDIDNSRATTLEEKLLNRVGDYLKTGSISIGSIALGQYSVTKKEALKKLKSMIDRINIQFDMYVRSNHIIIDRIGEELFNGQSVNTADYEHNYYKLIRSSVIDEDFDVSQPINANSKQNDQLQSSINLPIAGLHPEFKPHQFSLDFLALCRKRLLWCNAFATGLGKTSTALSVIQDQHNLGLKEKTLFTVPNSTLVKWFKEIFIGVSKDNVLVKPPVYDADYQATVFDNRQEESCLFVNLISSTQYKKKSNNPLIQYLQSKPEIYDYLLLSVDEQLELIKDDKYTKIFMSHEDFYRIRLKTETVENYILYQKNVDRDFSLSEYSETTLFNRRVEQYYAILNSDGMGKNKLDVYFEDLGIDSLVMDEAHVYKNSKESVSSQFDRIKYLSNPPASSRGIDMLAKANYIRQKHYDGILCLTATPITNSPVEIYSILSIVLGEGFINRALNINGLSDFITLFCQIESGEDYGVDGEERTFDLFKGLSNLKMLRSLLNQSLFVLNENDERVQSILKLPNKVEDATQVDMSKYQQQKIVSYKRAYQMARLIKSAIDNPDSTSVDIRELKSSETYQRDVVPVLDKFHENIYVLASPFNFISKMEKLVLDEDLNEQATIIFIDKSFQKEVNAAVKKFNNKKFKQKFTRLNVHTDESAVFNMKEFVDYDSENDETRTKTTYEFYSEAKIVDLEDDIDYQYNDIINYVMINYKNADLGSRLSLSEPLQLSNVDFDNDLMLVLDTTDYKEQDYFFNCLCTELKNNNQVKEVMTSRGYSLPEAVSTLLKFNISNKVVELLKNIASEFMQPRGMLYDGGATNIVKQLVFCDYLGIHFKLKHLFFHLLNELPPVKSGKLPAIPLSKIDIITGQYNGDNDQVQFLQDGFNAEDNDNLYQLLIMNKKCQVGIDLQNGTQAIHHITIGWTPDCLTQRNGRGVRQGNKTEYVKVNYYDMTNTFDSYKRNLVNRKDEWISTVIENTNEDSVSIIQMLSKEDQTKMISLLGEEDTNLDDYYEQLEKERIENEKVIAKERQRIYLDFIAYKDNILNDKTNSLMIQTVSNIFNVKNPSVAHWLSHGFSEYLYALYTKCINLIKLYHQGHFFPALNQLPINVKLLPLENFNNVELLSRDAIRVKSNKNVISHDDLVWLFNCCFTDLPIFLYQNKHLDHLGNADKRLIKSLILADGYMRDVLNNGHINLKVFNKDFPQILLSKMIRTYESSVMNGYGNKTNVDTIFNYDDVETFFISMLPTIKGEIPSLTENEDLLNSCKSLAGIRDNIYQMALRGYEQASKGEYAYYPASLTDHLPIRLYRDKVLYPTSMLIAITKEPVYNDNLDDLDNNIYRAYSDEEINDIFEQIKDIINHHKVSNNMVDNLFGKADKLNQFLLSKNISLFKFYDNNGSDSSVSKVYPINRYVVMNNNNMLSILNRLYLHKQHNYLLRTNSPNRLLERNLLEVQVNEALGKDEYQFIEIFENNEYYQLLLQTIGLLEYLYISKLATYGTAKERNNIKDVLTNPDSPNYFDYRCFDCYQNKIFDVKGDLLFDVHSKSIENINMILSDDEDAAYLFDKELLMADEFVKKNNLNISKLPNKEFLLFEVEKSFAAYQKYQYRVLSEEMMMSCYFHKMGNTSYQYKLEKEAFEAFRRHPQTFNSMNNIWVLNVRVIKVLLLRMCLAEDLKYGKIQIKKLNGSILDLIEP